MEKREGIVLCAINDGLKKLVLYINLTIVSVCVYVANKLENENRFLHRVFAEISRIYQGMFRFNYFLPDTFPDISAWTPEKTLNDIM